MSSILLENLQKALNQKIINAEQAMYLIYLNSGLDYPIKKLSLTKLVALKYVHNNKVDKQLFSEISNRSGMSGTIKAIYKYPLSQEVVIHLTKLLCVTVPGTKKIQFPNEDDSLENTANKFLAKEGLIAHHFIIFLFLFPIKAKTNRKWERHFFGSRIYKGARIRVRSKATGTLFRKAVKTRDMGVFLYGTYLYMQSCIQEDKAYVKTIKNYMAEFEDWYDEAEDLIKNAKNIKELFKRKFSDDDRLNVTY